MNITSIVHHFNCYLLPFVFAFENTSKASSTNRAKMHISLDASNKQRLRYEIRNGYQFRYQPPSFPICILNA